MNPRANMGDKSTTHTLDRLAADMGLLTTYRDGFGRSVTAPLESVRAVLTALGCEEVHSPERARRALWAERATQGIDAVVVAWNGRLLTFEGTFPVSARVEELRYRVLLERGQAISGVACLVHTESSGSGTHAKRCRFQVGLELPLGYHSLEIEGARALRTIISAPERLSGLHGKQFGLFAPVHSLRGATKQGVGTLSELRELCRWAGKSGASFVGVLPLLSTFLDHPYDPSPFAPASKLFWNDALLDLTALPELASVRQAQALLSSEQGKARLQSLDASDNVRFRDRMRLVEEVLAPLSRAWVDADGLDGVELRTLRSVAPDLDAYARFRALTEVHGPASSWSEDVKKLARSGEQAPNARVARHLYAQLRLEQQLLEVSRSQVGLYMDLPLGAHAESFDMHMLSECFVPGLTVGAPPDALSPRGQNWGFAPMHPEGQRRDAYAYFARSVRTQLRHARMLRIDHVMGLHRLFCVPIGAETADGLYVTQPHDELYAVLCLEVFRRDAHCIGEDLGVVPDEVRSELLRHGMLRMSILPFEVERLQSGPVSTKFAGSLASLNTHDMPTFAGLWAEAERKPVLEALRLEPSTSCEDALPVALSVLGKSAAPLVQVALEDLWGETRPLNTPGVFDPDVCFCRRMALSLDELSAVPSVQAGLDVLRKTRREPSESCSHVALER